MLRTAGLAAASLACFVVLFLPGTAHAQRQPFIDHLITFRSLLFGPYGDEGERILQELDEISAALAAWDDSVRAGEQKVRTSGAASTEPIREVQLIPDRSSRTPVFAPPAYAEGFSALAAGNYSRALDGLRAAAMRDPLVVDQALRSTVFSTGIARLRTGMIAEAIRLLESAASAYPDSSEAHRILGTAYGATGDSERGMAHLRRALSLAPRDGRSRLALARALRDAGHLDEAAKSLRESLTVLPRFAEARWVLADVLEQAGRGLDAARELEAAASATIIAGRSALYLRTAEIYDRHQEFDRVVALLRQRVSLDPNNPVVHRQLGLIYSRLGRREEALTELVMTDLLGGADAEALAAIGQIHLDAGRAVEAESLARRAVAAQPDRQDARYVLGRALLRQGHTAEAREQLAVFQNLRAGSLAEQRRTFEIDTLRAEAARASAAGRHRDAASVWQRIVERRPRVAEFHASAAEAFAASGEMEDAALHLEKAAGLGGGPAVWLRLAELYERLGRRHDHERARRAYEQQVKALVNSSSR